MSLIFACLGYPSWERQVTCSHRSFEWPKPDLVNDMGGATKPRLVLKVIGYEVANSIWLRIFVVNPCWFFFKTNLWLLEVFLFFFQGT